MVGAGGAKDGRASKKACTGRGIKEVLDAAIEDLDKEDVETMDERTKKLESEGALEPTKNICCLPPELRNSVYRYVLIDHGNPHPIPIEMAKVPGLLRVNRMTRKEAPSIYYSENHFECSWNCERVNTDKEANRVTLRKLARLAEAGHLSLMKKITLSMSMEVTRPNTRTLCPLLPILELVRKYKLTHSTFKTIECWNFPSLQPYPDMMRELLYVAAEAYKEDWSEDNLKTASENGLLSVSPLRI